MGKYVASVEKNHPNHFGSNKCGAPCKRCRYCQGIYKEESKEEYDSSEIKN